VLKVLHVAGGLEPELGGPTTAILNYVVCADGPAIESHLVSPIDDVDSPLARELRAKLGSHAEKLTLLERTGRFKGRASRWGISLSLARWLQRNASEFDVIVLHGAWMFSSVAGLFAARRAGKPCVLVPHESLTEYDVNRKGSAARIIAKRNLKRAYGKHCRLFVFTSRAEAAQSFPTGSSARQTVLPYPLYDDRGDSTPVPRTFVDPAFRIGFLGRLHPKKNVDMLLRAVALLPERFTLTIGGDGPADLKIKLESLAGELGIVRRVSWKGFISSDRKDNFFQSIDVLVMPSAFESFGIVAAEAMMRGVPAIVSPQTGAAEIIAEHGGGLAVESKETMLAEALLSLDRDRARMTELSKEAIAVSAKELSFSHIGARFGDQLTDVARVRT